MNSNIRLVGTSHISKDSVKLIESECDDFKPEIIAIELDKKRFHALMSNQNKNNSLGISAIRQVGITGYLFLLIGKYAQQKLGSIVGVEPGSDMKQGIYLAKKKDLKLALIDRDITITMRRFSKSFGFKQKMQLLWDLLSSPFQRRKIKIDLRGVPDQKTILFLMNELKGKYPGMYNSLVHERNVYMARNIFKLSLNSKVLAVVGAGHLQGIEEELKKLFYANPTQISEK